jgi:NADH-quinone oxidoreductase subunit N
MVGWVPVAALVAAASLLLGNVGALAQTSVRRLLAYSAIAHAGALLLGVIVAGDTGPGPVFYYAATYGLSTVGIFGVFAVLEQTGSCDDLSDLAGLHGRSPFLAGCLAIFVLSLAGIPPLAGFFGKFVVFAGALSVNGISGPVGWLAVAAIALSAVALYYYLLILKQALVVPTAAGAPEVRIPVSALIALTVAAGALLLLGIFPSVILGIFA